MSDKRTFRALVGTQSVDVTLTDETLTLNGTTVPYTAEVVRDGYLSLIVDGTSVPVSVEPTGEDTLRVTIAGRRTEVRVKDERALLLEEFGLDDERAGGGAVVAPMPGLVLDVLVEVGDTVDAEQGLLVLEAMKMENELRAPAPGTVTAIQATAGDAVDKNDVLIEIESE